MKKLFLLFILLLLPACAVDTRKFTIASTRDVTLKNVNLNELPKKVAVIGENCTFSTVFPIFGGLHKASMELALEDALKNGNGDIMVDGEFKRFKHPYNHFLTIPIFDCVQVKGTVINTKGRQ